MPEHFVDARGHGVQLLCEICCPIVEQRGKRKHIHASNHVLLGNNKGRQNRDKQKNVFPSPTSMAL